MKLGCVHGARARAGVILTTAYTIVTQRTMTLLRSKAHGTPKDTRFQIVMSAEDRARLDEIAHRRGVSAGEVIRILINRDFAEMVATPGTPNAESRRITAHIKQLLGQLDAIVDRGVENMKAGDK